MLILISLLPFKLSISSFQPPSSLLYSPETINQLNALQKANSRSLPIKIANQIMENIENHQINTYPPYSETIGNEIKKGNLTELKNIFSQIELDKNITDQNGNTLIMIATIYQHFHIIEYLIQNFSIDVNKANNHSFTPLMIASFNDNKEIVQFLLQNGANQFFLSYSDYLALTYAAMYSHQDVFRILINDIESSSYNIEVKNAYKQLAIKIARQYSFASILQDLLNKMQSFEIEDNYKRGVWESQIILLCNKGVKQEVELRFIKIYKTHITIIIQSHLINQFNNFLISAITFFTLHFYTNFQFYFPHTLYKKYSNNDPESNSGMLDLEEQRTHQRSFLNEQNNYDTQDNRNKEVELTRQKRGKWCHLITFICLAIIIFTMTYNKGQNKKYNQQNNGYIDKIIILINEGKTDDIDSLVQKMSQNDISETDNFNKYGSLGDTVLTAATKKEQLPTIKYFIEKGANPDQQDDQGNTSLIFAAMFGYLDIIKYLIEKQHADANIKNNEDETAFLYATQQGHLHVVKYLMESVHVNAQQTDDFKVNGLIYAAWYRHFDIVKYFIQEHVVDVNQGNYFGMTPLMAASEQGEVEMMKFLLSIGNADLNIKDMKGQSAIYYAIKGGHLDAVKVLVVDFQITLEGKNHDGQDVVEFAKAENQNEIADFIKKYKESDSYISER